MYAVVDIAGQQFKVTKDQNLLVPKITGEVGKSVEFDKVLLISNKGKISVGQPEIKGAKVKAQVLAFERGDKVMVFKKKRRKGYRVRRGHRQDYTRVLVQSISTGSTKKKKEAE